MASTGPYNVFHSQVYCEQTELPSGKKATPYCTYHGTAQVVNTHVAHIHDNETDRILSQKFKQLPDSISALRYLRVYQGSNNMEKGMRVLLLHWLEFSEGIRQANF